MVSLDCRDLSASPSEEDCATGARAFRTTLVPCLRTYGNVTYTNGVFDEKVISTTTAPYNTELRYYSVAGDFPSVAGVDCSAVASPVKNKTQPCSLTDSGIRYPNHLSSEDDNKDVLYYDPSCTYDFGYGPLVGLRSIFQSIFFGRGFLEANEIMTPRGIDSQKIGDAWLLALWAGGAADLESFTGYMSGVVASVTAAIRDTGDASNSRPATGQVFMSQTCIGVDWVWLTFPALLIVVTTGFLVPLIWQTRSSAKGQSGRKPWKSSTLPLLWCELGDSSYVRFCSLDKVDDMEHLSDVVRVQLARAASDENTGSGDKADRWVLQAC